MYMELLVDALREGTVDDVAMAYTLSDVDMSALSMDDRRTLLKGKSVRYGVWSMRGCAV